MSEPDGTIIDSDAELPRIAATKPDHDATSGNTGGTSRPETIAGFPTFEPDTAAVESAAVGEIPRRRGRPRGSRNTTRTGNNAAAQTPVVDLTRLLCSIGSGLAAVLNVQECEIAQAEARDLNDAIQEVLKHDPVAFDPKKLAYANLAVVATGIVGTRVMAYRARKREEKADGKVASIARGKDTPVAVSTPDSKINGSTTFGVLDPKVLRGKLPSDLWQEPAQGF